MHSTQKKSQMTYSDTLNLPKSKFPMRAELEKREPEILRRWEEKDIYRRLRRARAGGPKFVLHDGPPYANGEIHLGTALNKVLKDIIIKYKSMRGYDAPYVPGYDCHGLPIEYKVLSELGDRAKTLAKVDIRTMCRDFALECVGIMTEGFKRLGVFGDWERPYLTLSHQYEEKVITVFGELCERGYIYRGLKPIHWCFQCRTALAEAEVEYDEHSSPSIYVKFPCVDAPDGVENLSIIVWTTTPWTLPANLATCLHPDFHYAFVRVGDEVYLMAESLVPEVMETLGSDSYDIIRRTQGSELTELVYRHPFTGNRSPVILGNHVTLSQGTGCVHTAPGHGQEDYLVGRECGLEIFSPVNDDGRFTDEAGDFAGMHVFEANEVICNKLKELGLLLHQDTIVHSYPQCWRCSTPVLFRSTYQWFIDIDANDLRTKALESIEKVEWIPSWGKERIGGMVANRPDWCISRQRAWGVPIPAFYCMECSEVLLSPEVIRHVRRIVAEEGVDAWFTKDTKELLPEATRCTCGSAQFRKEEDILDVWFESGVSHRSVLETTDGLRFPADLYIEGTDQHRGWFQSSLLPSVAVKGEAPYRSVLTTGFVLDAEGRKMSKKLGNVIEPEEVTDTYGADVLRLWVASVDCQQDIRGSFEALERTADAYRRIRNTCRFLLGNLHDFEPAVHRVPRELLEEIDRWALHRLELLIRNVTSACEASKFHEAFHSLYNFCITDMGSLYLDILKDRLYTFRADSPPRRSAQTALYDILVNLLKLMAPILSFTAEEAWGYVPPGDEKPDSVHLALWPEEVETTERELEEKWDRLLHIRSVVSRALEKVRQEKLVGNSLEAKVQLYPSSAELLTFLQENQSLLPAVFIVSQVGVADTGTAVPGDVQVTEADLSVLITRAEGSKCERCWNYSPTVGQSERHPAICERCLNQLKGC